jgi:hypothetical protein
MTDILRKKNVLIVEDEYFIASYIKKILVAPGAYVVGPVGDLVGVMRLAKREKVDVA